MKRLSIYSAAVMAMLSMACGGGTSDNDAQNENQIDTVEIAEPEYLYGIDITPYNVNVDTINSGETVGGILDRHGISARKVDMLSKKAEEVFPLRQIRADKSYTTFKREVQDSTGGYEVLDYMVYHKSQTEYVKFAFLGDSVHVEIYALPIRTERKCVNAEITSSLWGAIMKHNMPYALADEVEEIYQWSIDFFGIQEGDRFAVIYDEKFTDTTSVGIGRIYGASFTSGNKTIYAIPYVNENGRIAYWDADGASLKKQMLKAPLKYTRISSKFTHKRLHPVHRVYRPHLGVDYAAPSGTPVHSVADGTVIKAGWGGGGGNTIYIKHSGGLQTGYLHLKSFAKGIKVGSKVSQGQLIGYVGSTGTSTGPHLDYRIWQNGTPIDPLKVTQQPQEPIAKKYFSDFERVRDLVISELQGNGSETSRITEDDIFRRPKSDSTQNN